MFENDANSSPSQNDEHSNSSTEYLRLASQACASGDAVLGMHLYLAAFERAQHGEGSAVDEAALEGLKQAWQLACKLKERSIAEYAFERLEPYLSSDEAAACAEQLQSLALDKLEEYGLSREDLEDMTDMISQDFLGFDAARLMRVEHVMSILMPPYLLQPYRNRPPYLVLHAEFLCIFHKPCNILPGICDIPLYCLIKNLAIHAVDVTQTVTDNPFPVININFYSIYFTFGFTNIQSVLLNKMGFYLRMLNKKTRPPRTIIYRNMPFIRYSICIVIIKEGCFHTQNSLRKERHYY